MGWYAIGDSGLAEQSPFSGDDAPVLDSFEFID